MVVLTHLVLTAALALVPSFIGFHADDPLRPVNHWPGWRGPTGLGYTEAKDLPLTWNVKTGENLVWKVALLPASRKVRPDENRSSPVVWGERVFVTLSYWAADIAPKEFPEHHVICFDVKEGRQLWDTQVPCGPWKLTDLRGGYTAPTAATDGERLYAFFGSSVLAALDFDGKIVWRKEITPFAFDVAIGTSPILYRDTVVLLCDQTNDKLSRLTAVDKRTGEIKWEEKRPGANFSHSTPILVPVNGKIQLIISGSHAIQGVDPENGKLIWSCRNPGDVPTPAFGSGLIYSVNGRGGPGIAVEPTGEGDVTKTHVRWTVGKIPDGAFSSPIIVDGLLYELLPGGVLKCWKMENGEPVYAERLPGVSDRPSPVATPEGRIYFASGGKSYVIQAGTKFRIVAANDLGDPGESSPAVWGRHLILKGRNFLFCVGNK
jgi:outer membrane protein assembly factor BamB